MAACAPHPRQADHLGADGEGLDPAGGFRQRGEMEDETPIAPFDGAGIGDGIAGDGEMAGMGGAEEGCDLARRRGAPVRRAGPSRGRRHGDATAPGIGRL